MDINFWDALSPGFLNGVTSFDRSSFNKSTESADTFISYLSSVTLRDPRIIEDSKHSARGIYLSFSSLFYSNLFLSVQYPTKEVEYKTVEKEEAASREKSLGRVGNVSKF